jgi:hypothetical protein
VRGVAKESPRRKLTRSPKATISRKSWLSYQRSLAVPPNNKPLNQLPSSMIIFRLWPLEISWTFFVDPPLWHLSSSTPRDSSCRGQQERRHREAGDEEWMVGESDCKIYLLLEASQWFHRYISTDKTRTSVRWETKLLDRHAARTGQPCRVTNERWNAQLAIYSVACLNLVNETLSIGLCYF